MVTNMGENEIYITVLQAEIEYLKTRIEPHDTGHIHTTISTLQHRVAELISTSRKAK